MNPEKLSLIVVGHVHPGVVRDPVYGVCLARCRGYATCKVSATRVVHTRDRQVGGDRVGGGIRPRQHCLLFSRSIEGSI